MTNDALNTIDNTPPASSVTDLPATTTSPSFTVSWFGSDGKGPGIATYNVYVSADNGPFTLWQSATTQTSATYTGQVGHTYGFYSVANDYVGLVQPTPASAQATTKIDVSAVATTTSIRSSENPARPGNSVTFTATVSPAQSVNGVPTGTIQFQIDGSRAGSAIELVNGSASLTSPALASGIHAVTAIYTSSGGLFAASSGSLAGGQNVVAPTTSVLTASTSSALFGQAVTFTVDVTSPIAGLPAPTGTVVFTDGSNIVGTATLINGVAQLITTSLALGSHSIHAVYGTSEAYAGSGSATASVSVRPDATRIVVSPSANPSPPNHAVVLTATVNPAAPGNGTPTGIVSFYIGKKKLGKTTLANGAASFKTKKLAKGKYKITVIYQGDANFTGDTSLTLQEVVKQPPKVKKPKVKFR